MAKTLIAETAGVCLWSVRHPSGDDEAFFIDDRTRTPESWSFGSRAEARAKFNERVENAKTDPSVR